MNNTKKIILIVLINVLMITMGIYYNNYMVDEYKIFIERNKLQITTLGLEEANVVIHGAGAKAVTAGNISTLKQIIEDAKDGLNQVVKI